MKPARKVAGMFVLLLVVCLITLIFEPNFLKTDNLQNLLQRTGLFGIISIGVAFVIITGGIDLSIGSVVCLVGLLVPWLLVNKGWSVPATLGFVAVTSVAIGVLHGLLVTKVRLQPFVVTLCGLLVYRGVARWLTDETPVGFQGKFEGVRQLGTSHPFSIPVPFLHWIAEGNWSRYQWNRRTGDYAFDEAGNPILLDAIAWVPVPMTFLILVALALVAGVFLNRTVYGRYLLALGRNEEAARHSGINTDRMILLAYVICAALAGFGGVLFVFDIGSVQPASFGNFYELYAIAAAVLGGCSLRGGEGTILGVVIGAAVMRVLYNSINLLEISTTLEFAIIGLVILVGVVVDELMKRYAARRRGD